MEFKGFTVRRRAPRVASAVALGLAAACLVAAGGGPAAAATAGLSVAMDSTGTDIAAIQSTGRVVHFYLKDGFWNGPAGTGGTARADSPIAEDGTGTNIVFIDGSGNVVDDVDSDGWHGPTDIGGTARAGSPIAINSDGSHVVFVDASGTVENDWYSAGAWHGPAAIGGTARADSPIAINAGATLVDFIDGNGVVVNDYASGGAWQGPADIGGSARAGSALAASSNGQMVAFINASGAVVDDWVSGGAWEGPAAMGGTARADSPLALDGTPTHAYFVNTSGAVVNDWVTDGAWQGPAGIGGSADAGSSIATLDGGPSAVAFFDPSGNLALDWATGGYWHGPGQPDTITTNFQGANWPDDSDNFSTGVLYVSGLSASDTYATASATADQIVGQLYSITGGNTVRMPINEPTVSSYWGTYTGAIDAAASKGNVILTYWAASNGKPADTNAFYAMWDTVVAQYGGTPNVFFEVINEPYGYSTADLDSFYSAWLARYPSVPRSRVILDGAGYASNVAAVGDDASLDGTRLAVHDYTWFSPPSTESEAAWSAHIANEIGGYGSRTIATEWGDWMDRGTDYDAADSSSTDVDYVRGVTSELRALGVGSTYWPGVSSQDNFALTRRTGTTLTLMSQSGLDRLQHAWGL